MWVTPKHIQSGLVGVRTNLACVNSVEVDSIAIEVAVGARCFVRSLLPVFNRQLTRVSIPIRFTCIPHIIVHAIILHGKVELHRHVLSSV